MTCSFFNYDENMLKRRKSFKAFTLIEIVIVVAILGILSVVALAANNPAQRLQDSKDTVRRAEVQALAKSLRLYYLDNNYAYPPTNAAGSITVITSAQFQTFVTDAQAGTATCSGTQASEISNAIVDYYNGVLQDPDGSDYYVFRVEDLFVVACSDLSNGYVYARIE